MGVLFRFLILLDNLFTREIVIDGLTDAKDFIDVPDLNKWYMVTCDFVNGANGTYNVHDQRTVINPSGGIANVVAFDYDANVTYSLDFTKNVVYRKYTAGTTYSNNFLIRIIGCIKKK